MARKAKVVSLGFLAVAWMEHYLVHGPGDVEGEPLEMDDEFAAFIIKSYRLNPTGTRMVRRSAISRPKGRAKSELAAFVACFEALGPSRFDHFAKRGETTSWGYAFAQGEPVGVPVKRPAISCFATELGQSGNTYDAIRFMLDPDTCSAALAADCGKIDVGLTRIILPGGGTIEPETAKDSSKDGGKETFVVFDETHLWTLPGIKRLHQVVIRNLFKRKIASGWAMETTTMYAPGEGSVAESTHDYAKAVAEGRVSPLRLVFDHKQASAKWDVTKRADRLGGLKEVYGPAAAWMDLEAIADAYDDPQTSAPEWTRYWFNRPVSLQGSFLEQRAWDECHVARPIPDGVDVVLALDGSYNGDSTGVMAIQVGEFPHMVVGGLWEKDDADAEWRVNYGDVEEHIRGLCRRWRVVEITADPYRWARSLEVLAAEGLPVTEFPQSPARMSPATKRLADMVNTRAVTHDGDPRLARHVSNAVLKSDSRGDRLAKETKNSTRKIDLAVCAVMGLDRAMNQPEPAPPAPVPQFFA
jgi:phage terminase large subunit-like protein